MNSKNSIIYPCEINKCFPLDCNCDDFLGTCLIVPVYLHDICPNQHLLVIVELYKNNHLYARQVKQIFTGNNKSCSCNNSTIKRLYAGDFEFYFAEICEPSCICVEVKTQYICCDKK